MTTTFSARFRSLDDPSETYALTDVVYRDRKGGLLEVAHDTAAWASRTSAEWRTLFSSRPDSGVWAQKEWVQPHIAPENVISLGEGHSPLLPGRGYGAKLGLDRLFIKQCGTSHTGSFKDLGMTVLVSSVKQAIAEGRPIRAIACASVSYTHLTLPTKRIV